MPFEVSRKRTVSDSIAVDIDNDGRMLFEISNGDKGRAEISLSEKEVDGLIWELCACMSPTRIKKLIRMLESWKVTADADAKAEREASE